MTQKSDSQSAQLQAVGFLTKIFGKDPRSTMLAVCVLIIAYLFYENHNKDVRNNQTIDTYNVLVFGLVKDVNKNGKDIEQIKTKKVVEDSLQTK